MIIVGAYPNSRFFSVTAYDDHRLPSQAIEDVNIVPLTSAYVNPYQPNVPYQGGQMYAVPLGFEGTPGVQENGCLMNNYNVAPNALDGTLRHQGANWNTDPDFFQTYPGQPSHVVDTPQHTNPPHAGYVMVRAYVDINQNDARTTPMVIVRDVNTGCAYPAAYALNVLQEVSTDSVQTSWLDTVQWNAHGTYDSDYLPWLCYATDSRNQIIWQRDGQAVEYPDTFGTYTHAVFPTNLPSTLAAAGEVIRVSLRLPVVPPTPCTNGCSRSGNEQVRYTGLSFNSPNGNALLSIGDYQFNQDANGYATLIVGTGATIPSWITPANGYTFVDLTQVSGYQNLDAVQFRNILTSPTFACSTVNVPYKTTVWTPNGSLIGDYLPVIDFPVASTLPPVTSELIGPSACGQLPVGVPAVSPACGLLPSNPMSVSPILAPSPGEAVSGAQPLPPIDIMGAGFGFVPGEPFSGATNYLSFTDFTQNWTAGPPGSPCTVTVSKWADNRIEAIPNVDTAGLCPMLPGDQLGISIWNPQTGAGPVTATVNVNPPVVSTFALSATSTLVGSAGSGGSVEINAVGPFIALSNSPWLQVQTVSGVGNTVFRYTYGTNSNANQRIGTLTLAGLTFTVTQVGASYTPATATLPLVTSGLNAPNGVAVDSQGNVYIADTGNNAIRKYSPSTQQLTPLVTSGMNGPVGVAVDATGNVYIADAGNHAIEQWNVAAQQLNTLASGLGDPDGVTFSAATGNLYFSDGTNNDIDVWNATNPGSVVVASSGLNGPSGLAVDDLGNVYFANTLADQIQVWSPATQQATPLVTTGLAQPSGVAVDTLGNVYFADTGQNAILKWNAGTNSVNTLVSTGLNHPSGVAVDTQGNVYVADTGNNAIKEFSFVNLDLSTTNVNEPAGAGTDSVTFKVLPSGTPVTATSSVPWLTITSVKASTISFSFLANTSGAIQNGAINVLGQTITVLQDCDNPATLTKTAGDLQSAAIGQPYAAPFQVTVVDTKGIPIAGVPVAFSINAGTGGASGTWSTTPPMPVATNSSGVATAPVLTANSIPGQFTVTATINHISVTFTLTNVNFALAASSVNVGSAPGNGAVYLTASGPWTAVSSAPWLQVAPGSASGSGGALISFSYAANTGTTAQTGAITIAGLTFTVNQASANYTQTFPVTTLISTGVSMPQGVAVDAQGDVYVADTGNNAVEELVASSQLWNPIIVSGLNAPTAVAVDSQGNLYVADAGDFAIKEWNASKQVLTALVDGMTQPYGVALDAQANVYFSDAGANIIQKWTASSSQLNTLITGATQPRGLALDQFGNIYFANAGGNNVEKWSPSTQQTTVDFSAGVAQPAGIAIDGQGNIYFSEPASNAILQWNAANQQLVPAVSAGLNNPAGLAVDMQGNVYVADQNNNAIKKITPAYLALSTTNMNEGASSGSDSLTVLVLPATLPITATSNQSWLTVTSVSGGTIGIAFQSNTSAAPRVAMVNVLGLTVTVTQAGDTVGALTITAGNNQTAPIGQPFPAALQVNVTDANGIPLQGAPVIFTINPASNGAAGAWSGTLPVSVPTDQNGNASAPLLTANNIAGAFTVTASAGSVNAAFTLTNEFIGLSAYTLYVPSTAGSSEVLLVAAGPWTAVSSASWLTVNAGTSAGAGNAVITFSYAANPGSAPQTATVNVSGQILNVTQAGTGFVPVAQLKGLITSGLASPQGVAVDSLGNVYIADTSNNAIKEWNAATQQVTTLVSGLSGPTGVAVDQYGNVYFTDNGHNAIKEYLPSTQQVNTLVGSQLSGPSGIAVDRLGNVYFSDTRHNAIKECSPPTNTVTTLVSTGLSLPRGVAVDWRGNVYFADSGNNALKEWAANTGLVTALISLGLATPWGVAVDGEGNAYVADSLDNQVKQWNEQQQQIIPLVTTGLKLPKGLALDASNNIYIASTNANSIQKLTQAYVQFSATSIKVGYKAGTSSFNVQVLPANTSWAATCNQSWLTITGISNGTVSFSYTANVLPTKRAAQINVLGQIVTVNQGGN